MKRCPRCGVVYPPDEAAAFFTLNGSEHSTTRRRRICQGCEVTARTQAKLRCRSVLKAADTRRRHAKKWIDRGDVRNVRDFGRRFGWEIKQMAHDIDHAHRNGCPYCFQLFSTMPHGLADVTLDIVDPEDEPDYRTNTRWVCQSCNREKARTPPALWGAKCRAWARWRAEHAADWPQGSLFRDWEESA